MGIYSKLSDEELKMFRSYITDYGPRDYDTATREVASPETLLRFWVEAKSKFLYKMMNNQLILRKNIKFEKNHDQMMDEISVLTDRYHPECGSKEFISAYYDAIHNIEIETSQWAEKYTNELGYVLAYWPDEIRKEYEEKSQVSRALFKLCSSECLASNRYEGPSVVINFPNGKSYTLSTGAKTIKAIGKIAEGFNLSGYEEFRIAHSQKLNDKLIEGTLCLSIHPLDYLTMSDNDCGWTSCMSWFEKGEYRQGTVEMMNSGCVVVAYLESTTNMVIRGGEWNSKRWRELFVVDENVLAGIKGYPYWHGGLEEHVLHWIKELAETNLGYSYEDEISTYETGNHNTIFFHTNQMYNDFYSNHKIIMSKNYGGEDYHINYSGVSQCLCCGEPLYDNYDNESNVYCNDCDSSYHCYNCDGSYRIDDMFYVDGEYYCEWCYDEYTEDCAVCGERHVSDDHYRVCLALGPDKIYEQFSMFVCNSCLNELNDVREGRINFVRPAVKYITLDSLEKFNANIIDDICEYFGYYSLKDLREALEKNNYYYSDMYFNFNMKENGEQND